MARTYKRDNAGRFAGSGSATRTTTGKAGGFANAAHRARVAQKVASRARRRSNAKRAIKGVLVAGAVIGLATRRR